MLWKNAARQSECASKKSQDVRGKEPSIFSFIIDDVSKKKGRMEGSFPLSPFKNKTFLKKHPPLWLILFLNVYFLFLLF